MITKTRERVCPGSCKARQWTALIFGSSLDYFP